MVVLDTNIIIDHLRQSGDKLTLLMQLAQRFPKKDLAISVITIQELYEGISTRNLQKEEYLLTTIAPLQVLSYSYEVAQRAGEIARDLTRPIEFADAALAATALIYQASLYTLNRKHFIGIKALELFRL